MSRAALSVLILLLVPASAVAQSGAPTAAPPSAPPDVVHTRDGGMVRGTLMERVPGSHVVIQTASGELRRIEEADLVSAGPAAPAVVTASAPDPGVPLRLVSDERLGFHVVTSTATATAWGPGGIARARGYGFETLCRSPCEASLPPGSHRLALARGDDTPIPAPSLDITGPATLRGEYTDNTAVRVAGWTILAVGVAAGLSLMLYPIADEDLLLSDDLYLFLGLGGGIAIVAAVVGAPLGFVEDAATIRFD